jgi:hypothetical protein
VGDLRPVRGVDQDRLQTGGVGYHVRDGHAGHLLADLFAVADGVVAQNGISRPSGVISSTQHFISCLTLRVYGSWKSWMTIMNAWSSRSATASGRLMPQASAQSNAAAAAASFASVVSVPMNADADHSFSSASRTVWSGMTRLET